MKFERNIGGLDRALRFGISSAMVYFGFFSASISDQVAGTILGVLGVLNLVVAAAGFCPLYGLIGFSTVSRKTEPAA